MLPSNTFKSVNAEAVFFLWAQWLWVGAHSPGAGTPQAAQGSGEAGSCRARCALTLNSPPPFYQALTRGCHQQIWQHVCVECTPAIYANTHTVNKRRRAMAGSHMCKLFLNLSHLT